MSQRRACKVLGQGRSSQRYQGKKQEKDKVLVKQLHELSAEHPRDGYRRMTARLKEEGFAVNKKRIQRLWRQEGLNVPRQTKKKRRLGSSENSCSRRRASKPHEVWALDFLMDQTEDGKRLKFLTIVDEFSRYCLSIKIGRKMRGGDVIKELERLMTLHGPPQHIRSDNGPEFIAKAVRRMLKETETKTLYIEPGAPWENGYSESFNSRFRDELLNLELFIHCHREKGEGKRREQLYCSCRDTA